MIHTLKFSEDNKALQNCRNYRNRHVQHKKTSSAVSPDVRRSWLCCAADTLMMRSKRIDQSSFTLEAYIL